MDIIGGVLLAVGYIAMFISGLWLLGKAFTEGCGTVLMYIFIPFYSVYFMFSRMGRIENDTTAPVKLFFAGLGIMILGGIVTAAS